jgi:lysophospholipase L1-like esterase
MSRLILCSLSIILSTAFIAPYSNAQTKRTMKYLALGDSYTIGESVAETDRWPVQLGAALGWDKKPEIIATTGWRTDDLMNAVKKAPLSPPYDMVSLLIGVNNQYQGKSADAYRPEFEELLLKAIELAGGDKKKVFVVSIPDYGFTPFGKPKQDAITHDIDAFNSANESIAKRIGVRYINITDISRNGFEDPALVAADGLHPSGKQYKLWVERIVAAIRPVTR